MLQIISLHSAFNESPISLKYQRTTFYKEQTKQSISTEGLRWFYVADVVTFSGVNDLVSLWCFLITFGFKAIVQYVGVGLVWDGRYGCLIYLERHLAEFAKNTSSAVHCCYIITT